MDRNRLDELTGLPTPNALDDALASSRLSAWLAEQARTLCGQLFRVAGDKLMLLLPERTIAEAADAATTIVASCPLLPLPHTITLSAIAFAVDRERHRPIREMLEDLGQQLYRAELASGRNHSNVVVMTV